MSNILNGWPDRIINGIAVEDKTYPDKLKTNQVACHEWLFKMTGVYPLIRYVNRDGYAFTFKSYKEFEVYRRTQVKFPGLSRSEIARLIGIRRQQKLSGFQIQKLLKKHLCLKKQGYKGPLTT